MNIDNLVKEFLNKPQNLGKGAGYLAKIYKTDKESIYKAKDKAKSIFHNNQVAALQNEIATHEDKIADLVASKSGLVDGIHSITNTYSSKRILTDDEIVELAGIDGITNRLGMVWKKLQPNGLWTYSIQVVYMIPRFYTNKELDERLKTLVTEDIHPYTLPECTFYEKDYALFLFLGDDHVGLKLKGSLFNNEYSGEVYDLRMQKIAEELQKFEGVEHFYIVRLGDEADGYNGKTTRYDHELNSEDNKTQFDIYTSVNKRFYDTIFSSGMAKNYTVINCNNSNHSGLGFSYMLNKAVEFYITTKFPQVEFQSNEKFITVVEWGNHVIGLTHGKDEKYMKRPLPLNLTQDTDLWLYDYYDNKGYSPNKNWISTIKADIHKYNVNEGKSGRYVNIPSVSGSSNWIEHNFGNTKPGALLETYKKNEYNIGSMVIRF